MQTNVDTTVQIEAEEKAGFCGSPLTEEQRVALGVAQYYRPYQVDRHAVLNERRTYWHVKRACDILCAALALVVLSPLILILMLAIVLEDPKGSPIFAQDRVGKGGKVFKFYKLRSMCCDAEEKLASLMKDNEFDGKAFKIKNDPRITKVGHFIRNTSMDELLQLVNILKGDMSIVGPRPPLPREVAQYDDYEKQRLTVTPGLTCFWQVYPQRHEITFDDWVALDVKYIAERSWWVDAKMILNTVLVLFHGNAD